MKQLAIKIDDEHFTYLDSITIEEKNYVAYMDENTIYVSEYLIDEGQVTFKDINDELYKRILKELAL